MRGFLASLLLLLVACDDVVAERPVGAPFTREVWQSCNKPGYCHGIKFDGTYGFGFGANCPGTRNAVVEYTSIEKTYESGKVRIVERERTLSHSSCH